MSFVAVAVAGATTVIANDQASKASAKQSKAFSDAAAAEAASYEKAQDLLEKNKNEAITDLEAANLKARGIITDAEEAAITRLNATEEGAIQTLERFANNADTIFASTEELILKDFADSGLLARDEIKAGTADAIETILGFNQKAIDAFKPYTQAGERALERTQFLSGQLTEDERQAHLEQFGKVEGSPLFEFRKREQSKALRTRQKAIGRVFSGKGALEEVGVVDRLSAEETERQFNQAFGLSQQGLQATGQVAGIQQRTGQQVSGLQQQQGLTLAQQQLAEGQARAGTRQAFGINRANLQSQLGTNISNVQLSLAEARQRLRANTTQNLARLAESRGTNIANIRTGSSAQQAGLISTAAQGRSNLITQQGQAAAQANLNRANLLSGFGGTVAGAIGFQQGLNQPIQPNTGVPLNQNVGSFA